MDTLLAQTWEDGPDGTASWIRLWKRDDKGRHYVVTISQTPVLPYEYASSSEMWKAFLFDAKRFRASLVAAFDVEMGDD